MYNRISIILFLCLSVLSARSSGIDSVAFAEHVSLWKATELRLSENPALQNGLFRMSFSEIEVGGDYSHAAQPLLYQLGKGHLFGQVKARSYIRMSENSAVWGNASYRTGKRQKQKWNSTSDFLLLYPYVMGDTIGGDLSSERYTFSGGWVRRMKRLGLGADINFRAEHEYRTRDPRPRCIVTDLSVSLGAMWQFCNYYMGATFGGRFYKQTNDVEFMREAGIIPEYQMVGLGADYQRFSGSFSSAYYKATGWTVGADLRPAIESGAYASAGFSHTPYKRVLTDVNALPISTLYLEKATLQTGWRYEGTTSAWRLFAEADYERRIGDENIAGNALANEYDVIGKMTMYRAHNATYCIGWGFTKKLDASNWTAIVKGGYNDYAADYEFPHRNMSLKKVYSEAQGQWQRLFKDGQTLSCTLSAAWYGNVDDAMTMPLASMDEARTELMNYTYASAKADIATANATVRFDIPLSVVGLKSVFATIAGGWTSAGYYNSVALSMNVGVTF